MCYVSSKNNMAKLCVERTAFAYSRGILLIIIIIINCNWVVTRWQCYFTCIQNANLVTNKFKSEGLHEKHVVAAWNLGNHLSIAYRHRKTKKNLCRSGRSQKLANTELWPAVRHLK